MKVLTLYSLLDRLPTESEVRLEYGEIGDVSLRVDENDVMTVILCKKKTEQPAS